jgi:glycosyltransferase involved in cell wall biosynthesis
MSKSSGRLQWDAQITMTEASRRERAPERMTDPYDGSPIELTIFVSCYNEAPYILRTLDTVCAAAEEVGISFEVIVIDDGSSDNSRDLVRDYIERHPARRIILRANRTNKGLAQNYVDGAFLGQGKYYRLSCGDNSEPKDSIVTILKARGDADMVIPYYESAEGKGWRREALSKSYTALVNLLTGHRMRYYNGSALHLRHNVLRWHSDTRGFGFQAELLCTLLDLGFTCEQVQIVVVEQREGASSALTFRNTMSVGHTILSIFIRRFSRLVYRPRSPIAHDEK